MRPGPQPARRFAVFNCEQPLTSAPRGRAPTRPLSFHHGSDRDSHRLGRPDRLRVRAPPRGAGSRRGRDRERHAQPLLRAGGIDRAGHRGAQGRPIRSFARDELDIRDADGIERLFARHAGSIEVVVHTAAQPSHDWAAREPQTDFGVNANGTLNLLEAARAHCPDAPFIFCSTNKVYGDTPNRLPLRGPADPARAARVPPLLQGHRHVDVDRPLDPLAVRRLEGRRRPAGAGVRALLRHADRLLPRRLPHRPPARRREAPRLPRLPDEVRGHRHARTRSSATRASRSATTSTAPTWWRPSRPSGAAPRAAAVYNIGGGRYSNCSMLEAIAACERIAGPRARVGAGPGAADRRSPLVDLRPRPVRGRLPGLVAALRDRGDPHRDVRAERRALDGDRRL